MPTGSELFVATLKRFGVTHIFTLVGDHLNDLLRVCEREGLRLIDVRHESAAVHMADGWTRLTRRPGVAMVTGGPGHTNSITGIATAFAVGSPVVAVSGMRHSKMGDRNAFQDLDQLSLVAKVTKWAAIPPEAAQLPFYLQRAFSEATGGRCWPPRSGRLSSLEAACGGRTPAPNYSSSSRRPSCRCIPSVWRVGPSPTCILYASGTPIPARTAPRRLLLLRPTFSSFSASGLISGWQWEGRACSTPRPRLCKWTSSRRNWG
ncbi:MAG: hypothetical protein HY236_12670 [Acidobacteria bacterium]|nr:hypothetical protein [Acidobacteriota bacterium]